MIFLQHRAYAVGDIGDKYVCCPFSCIAGICTLKFLVAFVDVCKDDCNCQKYQPA